MIVGGDAGSPEIWRKVPGRWIIVDGAFVQIEEAAVTESSPLPDQFRHLPLL
jgi:hypothetical protein